MFCTYVRMARSPAARAVGTQQPEQDRNRIKQHFTGQKGDVRREAPKVCVPPKYRCSVSHAGAYNVRNVMCKSVLIVKIKFVFIFFASRCI